MPTITATTWLSIAVVGLVLTSGYLGWRLARERASARASAEEHAQLRETLAELKEAEQQLRRQLASASPGASVGAATNTGSLLARSAAVSGWPVGKLEKSLGPVHPPQLTREHRITMTRMRYTKMLQESGLSETELDALLPLLSDMDHDKEQSGPSRTMSDDERSRFLEEVGKVVGHDRAQQVLQVKERAPFRMELGIVGGQLDALGAPLTKQQENEIVTNLVALGPLTSPVPPKPGEAPPRDSLRSWQEARHDRLLSAAEGILSPTQVQRLTEIKAMSSVMTASVVSASNNAGAPAP